MRPKIDQLLGENGQFPEYDGARSLSIVDPDNNRLCANFERK